MWIMKTIIFAGICMASILFANAQDSTIKKKTTPAVPDVGKYCAVLNKGKVTVTTNGKPLKTDVELKNGTKITTTGTVVKKDGSMVMMKSGECVNQEGNSVESASSN
jgi:hypothetical protein